MRNFSNRFRSVTYLLVSIVVVLCSVGCSMHSDNTIGSDIMPQGQAMVMRHLKFKGNTVISFDATSGEPTSKNLEGSNYFETRQYRTDSLISSNIGVGYLGVRRSDTLGIRTASFASTILYMNAIDEVNGFGYKPIFDTMKLVLTINNYGGDTLVPIRYKVYELQKPLAKTALEEKDGQSLAYVNCDLSGLGLYDEQKPIFEFTFPKSELKEGPATTIIPMENTDYSWDFARRLMLIPEDYNSTEWDGYGRSGIEVYKDDQKWLDSFHGLYIVPDLESTPSDRTGAMYALDLKASGIMLQGRNRNPKDPSMIKDTVGMYYYFCDESSDKNTSVNRVERDYTNALLKEEDMSSSNNERPMVSTCYVEGMGGPVMEVTLTDEFLNELLSIGTTDNGGSSKVGINQCLFTIYVDGAYYAWEDTQANASKLAPMLDKSFTRLGTYMDYMKFLSVIDYDYLYENSYGTANVYSGYLDRSRGCYVLNLTGYMQQLYNYAKQVRQEDGTFLFDANSGVKRVIYIGAEANNPFAFAESVLQGMPKGDDGNKVEAPIQIDLTYTLVK